MATRQKELAIHDAALELKLQDTDIKAWIKKGLIHSEKEDDKVLVNIDAARDIKNRKDGKKTKNNYRILKAKTKPEKEITSIELFAGAGGTALGMENAGIKHVLINENAPDATATLKKNRPSWNIIEADVKTIDFKKYKGTIDLVQGGFPCQAFSYAGKKRGFEDARGTLFYEFARVVKEVKPKIAIGENVKGLLSHDNGRTIKSMKQILESIGYKVRYEIVDSQFLDVPQKRSRLIIIAIRKDLDIPFIFPKLNNYIVSVRDAIENCPSSEGQAYSPAKEKVMKRVPEGGNWRDLPTKVQKEYMMKSYNLGGGKTGMARRLAWDEPSLTLTCQPAQKQTERCHPEETRPLSVREYARLQTFPDNWEFIGSLTSKYAQIGNAVPVNLGYHLGMSVREMLK